MESNSKPSAESTAHALASRGVGRADFRAAEFAMAGLWALMAYVAAFPPSGMQFMPWLTIPGFALGSVHFLKRSFDARPRILLNEEGIVDRTSIFGGPLLIPWSQVRGLRISRWFGGVQVDVVSHDALAAKAPTTRRIGILLARLFGKRTVTLNTTLLGMSRRELRLRLQTALDDYERVSLGLSQPIQSRVSSGGEEDDRRAF